MITGIVSLQLMQFFMNVGSVSGTFGTMKKIAQIMDTDSNFSGGQGQCISIARAMLRNADYLLLDEATGNLDVVSEAEVTGAMDELMRDKTTIMIAHNYAATRNADYIIVMKDGAVEAAGTPDELLKTNEYYRMFVKTL